jgi:uroporphyrinogen-III decarboxylase
MTNTFFLELAARGARMPIGTELILSEKPDPKAIKLDGRKLGEVMEEAAVRWKTPLALPLMDLAVEKEWLLEGLGVAAAEIPTWHFDGAIPEALPKTGATPRLKANCEAIRHIVTATKLHACGMSIGPFSLMTKLIADPISPVFLAGMGEEDEDTEMVEKTLALATEVILHTISDQIDAGAKAVVLCEPAANAVYFSPKQLEEGADTFERYVMAHNRRIAELLHSREVSLIFHDCGELTDDMVRQFTTLEPAMMSLGSSRALWEDARLVPDNIVLYGNLPSKKFYSDEVMSVAAVEALGRELLEKMRSTGHPFILGSECDVLSVPGSEKTIRDKVNAFLNLRAD